MFYGRKTNVDFRQKPQKKPGGRFIGGASDRFPLSLQIFLYKPMGLFTRCYSISFFVSSQKEERLPLWKKIKSYPGWLL